MTIDEFSGFSFACSPIGDVRATGYFIDTYVDAVAWCKTKVECGGLAVPAAN